MKLNSLGIITLSKVIIPVFLLLNACLNSKFPPSDYEIGEVFLGSAYDLSLDNDYAYVAHNDGVAIIDISDLHEPIQISNIGDENGAFGVYIEEDKAYYGDEAANLCIEDISDKNNPVSLSEFTITEALGDVKKIDTIIFGASWNGKLVIIDISDNETPEFMGSFDSGGQGIGLAYFNHTVYFANSAHGLILIDVSDLSTPVKTALAEDSYGAWDIYIQDGFLYLGKHNRGFTIYKIEEDNSLSKVTSVNNGGEVYGICKEGDYLYVADLQEGVEIWNISDKKYPTLDMTIEEYAPHDIEVRDGIIYLADQDRSFVIIDIQ